MNNNLINRSDQLSQLDRYEKIAAYRIAQTLNLYEETIRIILLNSTEEAHILYTSRAFLKNLMMEQIDFQLIYESSFFQGNASDGTVSVQGFDSKLDKINLESFCETNEDAENKIHELYRCVSTRQLMTTFIGLVTQVSQTPERYASLDESDITNIFHLLGSHLWARLRASLARIVELGSEITAKAINESVLFTIIALALLIFAIIFTFFLRSEMESTQQGCYSIIKHIPPRKLVNNKTLMALLFKGSSGNKDASTSLGQAIIRKSQDGLISQTVTVLLSFVIQLLLKFSATLLSNFLDSQLLHSSNQNMQTHLVNNLI